MERSEIEKLARETADRTVKLAKAEWDLHLEKQRNSLSEELRQSTQELKDLIVEVKNGPVTGISVEDHIIQHQKIADFLETTQDLWHDIVKKGIGYLFIGIISAAVTMYLGNEDVLPVIPKAVYHSDLLDDLENHLKDGDGDE